MSDISIKELLQTMSLDGIEDVIEIIRGRPDVKEVILVLQKEYDDMSEHFKNFVEGLPYESA